MTSPSVYIEEKNTWKKEEKYLIKVHVGMSNNIFKSIFTIFNLSKKIQKLLIDFK